MNKKLSGKKALALPVIATLLFGFTAFASANSDLLAGLTDTQKQAMEQIREIRQKADEETRAIAKEAGLTPEMMKGYRQKEMKSHMEAVQKAVETSDYNAFVEATADAPFSEKVTQDFFNRFVEAWNLRKSGDTKGAQEIMKELGIPGPHAQMMGKQRGMMFGHHKGMMKQWTEQEQE